MWDLQSLLQQVGSFELLVAVCGIYFSDQGWNLGPLHWEHRGNHQGSLLLEKNF